MRFEDLQYDFPKMPEEMRNMIEKEVDRQLHLQKVRDNRRKHAVGKTVAASLAAVMLFGTTAFAGAGIYRMHREQVGDHGVKVKVTGAETGSTDTAAEHAVQKPLEIPSVKMEVGYLPDGMVETEEGKYSFQDALAKGGVSITFYRMDTGDSAFEMLHENVLSSEHITVNGHEGVYLKFPHLYEDEITFDQRIYVAFTDVHYVMEMYAASDVEKQEALKIAEGIKLIPSEDDGDGICISDWAWSSYLQSKNEDQKNEEIDFAARDTASKEEMKHTHAIGEAFSAEHMGAETYTGLMAEVSDVQVSDDISLLDPALLDEDYKKETDADGKLLPAVIQYIKDGDADSLSEVITARKVPQKLVYVTVEYTNTGNQELSDVLFFGDLARIQEEDGRMRLMPSWTYEEPSDGDIWTRADNKGMSSLFEMQYYDVHGGERKNNYIASIQPGETAVVHMGWIVTEEELDKLYLSLDTFGGAYEFSDSSLDMGYVDIRQ